jgi:hypothetical protein
LVKTKEILMRTFQMRDMGDLSYFLGISITWTDGHLYLYEVEVFCVDKIPYLILHQWLNEEAYDRFVSSQARNTDNKILGSQSGEY